ncbi:MAG TPA: hypothetical protein VGE74_12365 [Gemmata sp.]
MNTTGAPIDSDRVQAVLTLVADWPEWERAALRAALRPKPALRLYEPDVTFTPVTGADLGEFPAVGGLIDFDSAGPRAAVLDIPPEAEPHFFAADGELVALDSFPFELTPDEVSPDPAHCVNAIG